MIHPIKSNLIPSQELTILGFILNSLDMSVRLSSDKKSSLKTDCTSFLNEKKFAIREVARVIGKIVSSFPGVMHGPLYNRNLEEENKLVLKLHKGNFDALMELSLPDKNGLEWWIKNVDDSCDSLSHGNPEITITTDASKTG